MFGIIGGLLGGWILALFGFESVVIAGMAQLFGITINATGYYFLFALMGAIKSILIFVNRKPSEVKFNLDDWKKKK